MKAAIKISIDKFTGNLIFPEDVAYSEARKIWNAVIDRYPAVIIQCKTAGDVSLAIEYARNNRLEISVRGAGHNIAGNSICDDGAMIDLSLMKNVRIDAEKRRAFVEPGATLADFDQKAQEHALATPVGINSTTGISGLTLGGGFGWLTRKYGLTIDNLISAEIITSDGKKLKASAQENPDLFWAIRGGGGNFGIVTQFEFRLYPVGPDVLAGLIVFPLEQAKILLEQYRKFMDDAPPELNVWVVLRKAPPLPFLPQHIHGKGVTVFPVFYAGDIAEGEKLIDPIRRFAKVVGEHVGAQPYTQWQQAFDPLLTPGARNYWKSHNFLELNDELLDTVLKFADNLPDPQCEVFIGNAAGAANKIPSNAMAYPHRDTKYIMNVHGRWDEKKLDERCISWARSFFTETMLYATPGTYVNFMTGDEDGKISVAYGPNYNRLVQIKRKYDPQNIFHVNLNIKP